MKEVELKKQEWETFLDQCGLHSAINTEHNGVSYSLKLDGVYLDTLNQRAKGLLAIIIIIDTKPKSMLFICISQIRKGGMVNGTHKPEGYQQVSQTT